MMNRGSIGQSNGTLIFLPVHSDCITGKEKSIQASRVLENRRQRCYSTSNHFNADATALMLWDGAGFPLSDSGVARTMPTGISIDWDRQG